MLVVSFLWDPRKFAALLHRQDKEPPQFRLLELKEALPHGGKNVDVTDRNPSPSAMQYSFDPTTILLITLQNICLLSHAQPDLLHKEEILLTQYKCAQFAPDLSL